MREFAMKYLIFAVLIIALLNTPAWARLGEDENTSNARYGHPVRVEQVENFDKKIFYHNSPYNLTVTFKDGKTVIITYQLDNKGDMSIQRISSILDNNAKKEGGWESIWYFYDITSTPARIEFMNQQQNATAVYDLSDKSLTVRYKTE
jgi:hypothetical protein